MLYSQALASLSFALDAGNTVFLEGDPGIGKTAMVHAACAAAGRPLIVENVAGTESVDWRGLPGHGRTGDVEWSRPVWFSALVDAARGDGPRPVLFVDEANAGGPGVEQVLMQLTLEHRVGPHVLPAGVDIVLAGNPQKSKAAGRKMGSALRDRVTFLDVEADLSSWLAWAARKNLDAALCAFLMFRGAGQVGRPGLFSAFDPDARSSPTPRGWHMCDPYYRAPDAIRRDLIAGKVGGAAADEVEAFLAVFRGLPAIAHILADPDNARVPAAGEMGLAYAVAVALSRKCDPANFANALRYMARVGADFQAAFVTDAIVRQPGLCETDAYIRWECAQQGKSL